MGQWMRVANPRSARNPYGRPEYVWQADDEDDEPGPKDFVYLRDELHGRQVQDVVAFDDRAGMPKQPNTSGGGYKSGGKRQSYVFRQHVVHDKPAKKAF